MGNCVKTQAAIHDDDEWRSPVPRNEFVSGNDGDDSRKVEKPAIKEVKIKISKKQLEELMGVQGLTVEQMLVQLINAGECDDRIDQQDQRPWKPALQSIPE